MDTDHCVELKTGIGTVVGPIGANALVKDAVYFGVCCFLSFEEDVGAQDRPSSYSNCDSGCWYIGAVVVHHRPLAYGLVPECQ